MDSQGTKDSGVELPPILPGAPAPAATTAAAIDDLDMDPDGRADDPAARRSKHPSTVELTSALGIQTKARSRRVWTREEDEKLRRLVAHWGDQRGKNSHWDQISAQFENRTNKDCRKRWFHSLDPTLKRGRWTEDEDRILLEAYNKMGSVWNKIAQLIPGRTDDQCSKRYNDVLDPSVRDRLREWTKEEDDKLVQLVEQHGTQWRTISSRMQGRTGLTCRNRWRKIVSPSVPKSAKRPSKRKRSSGSMDDDDTNNNNNLSDDDQNDANDLEDTVMTDSTPGSMRPPMQTARITSPNMVYSMGSTPSSDVMMSQGGSGAGSMGSFDNFKSSFMDSAMNVPGLRRGSDYSSSTAAPSQLDSPMTTALLQQVKNTPIPKDSPPQEQDYSTSTSTTTQYTFSLGDGLRRTGAQDKHEMQLSHGDLEALVKLAAANGQQIVIHQHNYTHHHHHHYSPGSGPSNQPVATARRETSIPQSFFQPQHSHHHSQPSRRHRSSSTSTTSPSTSFPSNSSSLASAFTPNTSTTKPTTTTTSASAAPDKPQLSTSDVANLSSLFSELEDLEDLEDGTEFNPFEFARLHPPPPPQAPQNHKSHLPKTTLGGPGSGPYKMEELQFAFAGIPFNPS